MQRFSAALSLKLYHHVIHKNKDAYLPKSFILSERNWFNPSDPGQTSNVTFSHSINSLPFSHQVVFCENSNSSSANFDRPSVQTSHICSTHICSTETLIESARDGAISIEEFLYSLLPQEVVISGEVKDDGCFYPFILKSRGKTYLEVFSNHSKAEETHQKQGLKGVSYQASTVESIIKNAPENTGIVIDVKPNSFKISPENMAAIKNLITR